MMICDACKGDLVEDGVGYCCPIHGRRETPDPEHFYDIPPEDYERRIQEEIDDED